MSELKTLKDLEKDYVGNPSDYRNISEVVLKQEAIKWVKEFGSENWEDVDGHSDLGGSISIWIKHFFNITEDDLQ